MSVLTLKRVVLFVVASLFGTALLAGHPSPRFQAKMAFDEQAGVGVLFGGRGNEDPAVGLTLATDETWIWTQNQWIQINPVNRPPGRAAHGMTYDSTRGRVLLFGGRMEATELQGRYGFRADLWAWEDGNWYEIDAGPGPSAREYPALAFDRDRDRLILFGGFNRAADGITFQSLYDTWEFDGSAWTQVSTSGPEVRTPLIAYDQTRKETILMGVDTTAKTLMYRWKVDSASWEKITPATLPTCVNEGNLAWQSHNQTLVVAGGVCDGTTSLLEETWEWNGTDWAKLTTNLTTRYTGAAAAYDTEEHQLVRFGGTNILNPAASSGTFVLRQGNWRFVSFTTTPEPRSLAAFRRDPARDSVWLLGGLSEFSYGSAILYIDDFWRYQGGRWYQTKHVGFPQQCATPLSAFDTDRDVLVVLCAGTQIHEWDGESWKTPGPDKPPQQRRFASMVYDANIKKTVLFGGFDEVNFRDDTWTWDGTRWTEVKTKNEPENRAQVTMWYDPLAKKTVLFSGVGRPNIDSRVTRFNDMWSFDGTNWTKLNVSTTPGIRFGTQSVVDPRNGKLYLFGGLRATVNGNLVDQFYGNDMWVWDGAVNTWTQLNPESLPTARQNGSLEYDPTTDSLVLFGGFAGNIYKSDTWRYDGQTWTFVTEDVKIPRRRGGRK